MLWLKHVPVCRHQENGPEQVEALPGIHAFHVCSLPGASKVMLADLTTEKAHQFHHQPQKGAHACSGRLCGATQPSLRLQVPGSSGKHLSPCHLRMPIEHERCVQSISAAEAIAHLLIQLGQAPCHECHCLDVAQHPLQLLLIDLHHAHATAWTPSLLMHRDTACHLQSLSSKPSSTALMQGITG